MTKQEMLDSELTHIGVRECLCDRPNCGAVRVFIIHPQIDEDGVMYATVPAESIDGFIAAIKEASAR